MVKKRTLNPYREAKLSNAMITTMVVGAIVITVVLFMLFATPGMA